MTDNFSKYYAEKYEEWFDANKWIVDSEILALKCLIPEYGSGIQINIGTGQYAVALGIQCGSESSKHLRYYAIKRGIALVDAKSKELPFAENRFDFTVISSMCTIKDPLETLSEMKRILKPNGNLIVGFSNKKSRCFDSYHAKKFRYRPCINRNVHTMEDMKDLLDKSKFEITEIKQTINDTNELGTISTLQDGCKSGAFVVLKCKSLK